MWCVHLSFEAHMKLNESVGSIDWKFYALWRGNTSNSTHICIVWSPPRWKILWSLAENADAWLKMPISHPWKIAWRFGSKDFPLQIRWFVEVCSRSFFGARYYLSGVSKSYIFHILSGISAACFVENPSEPSFTNKKSNNKMAHVVFRQPCISPINVVKPPIDWCCALLWAYQISKLKLSWERPSCFTIFNLHELIFHLFFCFSEKKQNIWAFQTASRSFFQRPPEVLHPGGTFVTRVLFPQNLNDTQSWFHPLEVWSYQPFYWNFNLPFLEKNSRKNICVFLQIC